MLLTPSTERWIRARLPLLVLAVLLCLGAANVASRATWREVEDGVLWIEQNGVVAAEIAPGTPAELSAYMHAETDRFTHLIKLSGLRAGQ